MMNNISKNSMILGAFALATTAMIGLTFVGTSDRITQQRLTLLQQTLEQVMPSSFYDNALAASCTLVADERLGSTPHRVYRATKEGESIGFVVESTAPNGYSGKIHMLTGMLMNGTVTGVRVLDHKETPGLGDKIDIRISDWILSFNGQQVSEQNSALWEVKKDGGQFDQFTGATITPRAVVNQVELTIITAMENSALWAAADNNCDMPAETNDE